MLSPLEIPEVRPLRPRHPADQLRLLYWLCFDPARFHQYSEQNLSETLLWLVSTLVWTLAAFIRFGDQPPHIPTLFLIPVGWWVTGRFGAKRIRAIPLADVFWFVGFFVGWLSSEAGDAELVMWLLAVTAVLGVASTWGFKPISSEIPEYTLLRDGMAVVIAPKLVDRFTITGLIPFLIIIIIYVGVYQGAAHVLEYALKHKQATLGSRLVLVALVVGYAGLVGIYLI